MKIPDNISKVIRRKGLNPNAPYIAKVLDNNDPDYLNRIRARIDGVHDHLEDDEIPWATRSQNNPTGLAGGQLGRTGSVSIPAVDSMVALYHPHNGDPLLPQYGSVPTDKKTILPEFKKNYPFRVGSVLPSGYTFIHDMKTNESFLEVPGDANLTVLGDVNLTAVGNIQMAAVNSTSKIPSYIANAPERLIGQLNPNPQGKIEFKGLYGGGSGNIHFEADGHITMKAGANFKSESNQVEVISKGKMLLKAGGKNTIKGSRIDLN